MATEVIMPQMGESIAEGTITKWLVQVGERVERDQPLFEISTDKVDAEIPSPASGRTPAPCPVTEQHIICEAQQSDYSNASCLHAGQNRT